MAMSAASYYGSVLPHDPFYVGNHHQAHHFQQNHPSRHMASSSDNIKFDLASYGSAMNGMTGSSGGSAFDSASSPASTGSVYGGQQDVYQQTGHHVASAPPSNGSGVANHLMGGGVGGGAAAPGFNRFSSTFDAAVRSLHCKTEVVGPNSLGSGYMQEPAVGSGAPSQHHVGYGGLQPTYHHQTTISAQRFSDVEDRVSKLSAPTGDQVGQSMIGSHMGLVAGQYGIMTSSGAPGQGFNPSSAATAAAAMMAAAAMQASIGGGHHHHQMSAAGIGPCAGSAAGLPIYPWMRSMAAGE